MGYFYVLVACASAALVFSVNLSAANEAAMARGSGPETGEGCRRVLHVYISQVLSQ